MILQFDGSEALQDSDMSAMQLRAELGGDIGMGNSDSLAATRIDLPWAATRLPSGAIVAAAILPPLETICSSSAASAVGATAAGSKQPQLSRRLPPCSSLTLLLGQAQRAAAGSQARSGGDDGGLGAACGVAAAAHAAFASSTAVSAATAVRVVSESDSAYELAQLSASASGASGSSGAAYAELLMNASAPVAARPSVVACPPLCAPSQLPTISRNNGRVVAGNGRRLQSPSSSFLSDFDADEDALAASALLAAAAAGGIRDASGERLPVSWENAAAAGGSSAVAQSSFAASSSGLRVVRPCSAALPSGSFDATQMSSLLLFSICSNASDPRSSGAAGLCPYGEADDCVPCPAGGLCPGGHVLWSTPGWFVASEDSQQLPFQCAEPATERCTGWDAAAGTTRCGAGYDQQSFACSACKDGFYSDSTTGTGGGCQPCPASASLMSAAGAAVAAVLTAVATAAAVLAALCVVSMAVAWKFGGSVRGAVDRAVSFFFAAWLSLQAAAQASAAMPSGAPQLLQGIFRALRALQLQGIAPVPLACTGLQPFAMAEALVGCVLAIAVL